MKLTRAEKRAINDAVRAEIALESALLDVRIAEIRAEAAKAAKNTADFHLYTLKLDRHMRDQEAPDAR